MQIRYKLKYNLIAVAALLLSSCSSDTSSVSDINTEKPQQQTFTVVVESVGELFEGGEGVNPGSRYFGVAPSYLKRHSYTDVRQAGFVDYRICFARKGGV